MAAQLAMLQGEVGQIETLLSQSGASAFWLWFTGGGMLLATVAFLYLATSGVQQNYHHYVTSALITLWAALMYVLMASGNGIVSIDTPDGERLFYWLRYVDWAITTPLLLVGLSWVALGGNLGRSGRVVAGIVVADVLMILFGLWAGAIEGGFRWVLFIISSVFFAIVLALIWGPLRTAAQQGPTEGRPGLFFTLAVMLTVLWLLYPVVWIVGTEGVGAVSSAVEVFFFAVLDILAKIAFGFTLLGGIRAARQARAS